MKNVKGAIILAIGIAASGYFVFRGISKYAEKDRCVTVKGLSERDVLANRVTWPMNISLEGNDYSGLYASLEEGKDTVIAFLKENGIPEDIIMVSAPDVTDRWEYQEVKKRSKMRYSGSIDITLTSRDVPLVLELMRKKGELVKRGVCLNSEEYSIRYDYVDLSNLKPEMVEEATKDARKVAEKFAKDAGCQLGSIINATQGQFTVEEEYYRPQYKQIRVVTTISYYLK